MKHFCTNNIVFKVISLFIYVGCTPFAQNSFVSIKNPELAWVNGNFDYGHLNIGASSTQIFTLVNQGQSSAAGCGLVLLSDYINFSVVSDTCTSSVMDSNGACNVEIASHPINTGVKNLTIARLCSDGIVVATGQNQITVTGVAPELAWTPLTHDFGNVNVGSNSGQQVFTLINSGTADATGCGIPTINDNTHFSIVSNTCGFTDVNLSGGGCTVTVQANPTSPGAKSATISRSCAVGGTVSTDSQLITTTGVSPVLAWNPFTSCPVVNVSASFRLPATCLETLSQLPLNPVVPFDYNTGATYTFSLTGSLPPGLSFDPNTGAISGTPTTQSSQTVEICRVPSPTDCQSLIIDVIDEIDIPGPLVVSSLLCSSSTGTGTNADPIHISSISDLDTCVRNYPTRAFLLTSNLDFTSTSISSLPSFRGIFDGGSFEISNWSSTGPLFLEFAEGALVRNLKLKDFNAITSGALSNHMKGAIVRNITFENITVSGPGDMGVITNRIDKPVLTPAYKGYIEQISLTGINYHMNQGYGWSWAGAMVMQVQTNPYRISNITFNGTNSISAQGHILAAVVGANPAVNYSASLANSNLWIDRVRIESGMSVTGFAFSSSIISIAESADVISNVYSYANISASGIGGAGLVGNFGNLRSAPVAIVNSFFAGSLTGEGSIAGSSYSGGSVALVNTASLNTISQPPGGSANVVSSSHSIVTDANFKDPGNAAFSKWFSFIWNFQVGFYPALF